MSGNIKFRWFLLAPLLVVLFVVVTSPVVSWAGYIERAQEQVRQRPGDPVAHHMLGWAYRNLGQYQEAIASFKESIRINTDQSRNRSDPDYAKAHYSLGNAHFFWGVWQKAIASYKVFGGISKCQII